MREYEDGAFYRALARHAGAKPEIVRCELPSEDNPFREPMFWITGYEVAVPAARFATIGPKVDLGEPEEANATDGIGRGDHPR